MRYQAALRPDGLVRLYRESNSGCFGAAARGSNAARLASPSLDARAWLASFDATIEWVHGGYSSAAERLTVAQDVVGSIPTSRPNLHRPQGSTMSPLGRIAESS